MSRRHFQVAKNRLIVSKFYSGNLEIGSESGDKDQLEKPEVEPRERRSPRAAARQSSTLGPSPPQPRVKQKSPYMAQRRKVSRE